jgi:hypothetical protein
MEGTPSLVPTQCDGTPPKAKKNNANSSTVAAIPKAQEEEKHSSKLSKCFFRFLVFTSQAKRQYCEKPQTFSSLWVRLVELIQKIPKLPTKFLFFKKQYA